MIKAKLEAGVTAYRDAGKLLLEAKAGLKHGEFQPWIERHFKLSYTTATIYMRAAKVESAQPFKTLADVRSDPTTARQKQRRHEEPEERPATDARDLAAISGEWRSF